MQLLSHCLISDQIIFSKTHPKRLMQFVVVQHLNWSLGLWCLHVINWTFYPQSKCMAFVLLYTNCPMCGELISHSVTPKSQRDEALKCWARTITQFVADVSCDVHCVEIYNNFMDEFTPCCNLLWLWKSLVQYQCNYSEKYGYVKWICWERTYIPNNTKFNKTIYMYHVGYSLRYAVDNSRRPTVRCTQSNGYEMYSNLMFYQSFIPLNHYCELFRCPYVDTLRILHRCICVSVSIRLIKLFFFLRNFTNSANMNSHVFVQLIKSRRGFIGGERKWRKVLAQSHMSLHEISEQALIKGMW